MLPSVPSFFLQSLSRIWRLHLCGLISRVNSLQNSLWSKSIRHYLNPTCNSFSATTKAIRKGLSLIYSNSSSIIRNGKNTDIWFHNWFTKAPLRSLIAGPLNKNDDSITVNVFANDLGSWSWELLCFDLPLSIKDIINAIPCLKNALSVDFITCNYQKNGSFSLNLISGFVGYGNALNAELWAIASGIKVAISLGCNHLWIESNSLLACMPFGISLMLSYLIPPEKEINVLINLLSFPF
ncbi:reverse transcriptase [Senna tora]|uniref:Reverse transcriptase n=1 Tax=Senna tora TaxID=362788 RepID=A0A834WPE3_9FABA|nr:reverse transcriptase [Senna tora]